MHILFSLAWIKSAGISRGDFKSKEYHALFLNYLERISHFVPCRPAGLKLARVKKEAGVKLWLCEREKNAKIAGNRHACSLLTSEQIAAMLGELAQSGSRELQIVIGGPNGFTKSEIESLKPDFLWSFGPLTFPHELASVMAAEQIYRAWTILRKHPYHLGH